MRNILILGAGRSGTSMVAGTLAKAGYFMGEQLIKARETNPKGFFEDIEVNSINEDILARVVPRRPQFIPRKIRKYFFRKRPARGQRWLAKVPLNTKIPLTSDSKHRIEKLTSNISYCFKDPRFSYTLPNWRPFLDNTFFVCVFREPSITVESILKECRRAKYLHSLAINREDIFDVWTLMYSHILETHCFTGKWLFLHFDQVVTGNGLERLAGFAGANVDTDFPDIKLKRSKQYFENRSDSWQCYVKLCELADYKI
ncbi:MAG: hypothetical protein HF978_14550 [Desulfobacteraceae bacterium]|nr:hypothetical protein [Desulfobacteraceae bacterium]MBC2756760.1 hypothetical protein [Desulfobacteraceae bacterium]